MKKMVIALMTCALAAILPITAFAATNQTSASDQVQLKDLPVVIDGVKYAQNDPHVKNVTDFVIDDAAKAQGVIHGYTSKDLLNTELQSAAATRKNDTTSNTITPQAVYYNSYFYKDINYGGGSFGASSNISYVGSYWNDKISSLKAGYNHTWTVLCWDINYGGSRFWVQSGINVSYVGSTWNDKASSIFFSN